MLTPFQGRARAPRLDVVEEFTTFHDPYEKCRSTKKAKMASVGMFQYLLHNPSIVVVAALTLVSHTR